LVERRIKLLIEVPCYPNYKNPARLEEERKLMDGFSQNLRKGGLVVDFGCGTSYYTGDKNVIGIDLDRVLLKDASVEHKILADFRFSPLRDSVIDGVVMCHTLEHSNLPWIPLREASRILKVGGVIGVSVPNMCGLQPLYNQILRQDLINLGADHLAGFTPKKLVNSLLGCGFKVLKRTGDIVYFPLMQRLRLMRFGYWLANRFSDLSNVVIVIAKKVAPKNRGKT